MIYYFQRFYFAKYLFCEIEGAKNLPEAFEPETFKAVRLRYPVQKPKPFSQARVKRLKLRPANAQAKQPTANQQRSRHQRFSSSFAAHSKQCKQPGRSTLKNFFLSIRSSRAENDMVENVRHVLTFIGASCFWISGSCASGEAPDPAWTARPQTSAEKRQANRRCRPP